MEPIQVGGQAHRAWVVARGLAVLGVVAGIGIHFVKPAVALIVLGVSLGAFVIVELVLGTYRRKRRWITDTGEGFIVKDRLGERAYEDEDVFSVELETARVYSQGVFKGIRRKFRMKVEAEPKALELDNMIREGQADALGGMVQRLIDAYRASADEALRAGAVVQGKNWSLTRDALTVNGKPPLTVPLLDLATVGVFDGEVCVWRKGVDTAILKTPERSANAFMLHLLLDQRLAERDPEEQATSGGLGRVLFERKGTRVVAILLWILLILGLLTSLLILVIAIIGGQPGAIFAELLILFLCGLCFWGLRVHGRTVFRCHERGVFKQGTFSSSELRYEDVERFTYSATRQYYNGAYIGTALGLTLAPRAGSGKKAIRFSRSVKNVDESLDNLRDHIAAFLAGDMLRRLSEGERVQWTSNLALLPDGIEYRPAGFVKRKGPIVLSFKDINNFDLQQGTFHLWERGKAKSVMQESVGEANFFPGYFALARLFATD